MAVRVFVSSTCKDLGSQKPKAGEPPNPLQNCRLCAIKAIENSGGVAIAMERWSVAHLTPVEVCQQELRRSTHYLGIFAYRRGALHPTLKKSMTEAEYEWAHVEKKPVAVMLPNVGSSFNTELEVLAGEQTEEEREAQQSFLERVRSLGGYTQFDDPADLSSKVTRIVVEWRVGGSIEALAEAVMHQDQPTEKPILIGRTQHLNHFFTALGQFVSEDIPRVGAFLVHGRSDCGHDEMVLQLLKTIRDTRPGEAEPEHIKIGIKPTWRQNGLARLFDVLGMGTTHQAVAARLEEKLAQHDVVLEFTDVQRFQGSLPGFINSFWTDLAGRIGRRLPNRLIVLLRVSEPAPTEWDALLQAAPLAATFDLARPLRLPELSHFTKGELLAWLKGKVPAEEVDDWGDMLMEETAGQPQLLFNKLRSEIDW